MKAISVILLTVRSFYLQPYDAVGSYGNHVTGQEVMVSPVQHNEEPNIKEKTQFSLGIKCFHFAYFYIRTTFTTKVQYNIARMLRATKNNLI